MTRLRYLRSVRRALALLILIVAIAPGTWWRGVRAANPEELNLSIDPLDLPTAGELAPYLGPFQLDAAWQLDSPRWGFGGFSGLVALPGGRLLAVSDKGKMLIVAPAQGAEGYHSFGPVFHRQDQAKSLQDLEAVTRDPESGLIWTAQEFHNAFGRYRLNGERLELSGFSAPDSMKLWGTNSGPEAMTRLQDGRFLVISEGKKRGGHPAVIFAGDPVVDPKGMEFSFAGIDGFNPTDMAQLPDGRVLILFRRPVWPLPARFAGRIAIADPSEIEGGKAWFAREVAKLPSHLLSDNFEGLAIEPLGNGTVTVWMISDDNSSPLQRTLLWKLSVDPDAL